MGAAGASAQSTGGSVGRWAQSSALLSPSSNPALLVVSGKAAVAGQTVTSTPSVSSALSLDLSSPIPDLSSPTWVDLAMSSTDSPTSAYASLIPLSDTSALFFGGDATGSSSPAFAVQTGNDSSFLLALSSSSSGSWAYESASAWPAQPQRREMAYTASATNGSYSRAWVYGGQKADGSGSAFGELWELSAPVASDSGEVDTASASWKMVDASGSAPPAMFDGTAVLVPSSQSGALPSIYLIGGVSSPSPGSTSAASLSSVYVFTPSSSLAMGSWSTLSVSGSVPGGRRGAAAVHVGDGKIWIQGGRSADGQTVYSDAAVLDTKSGAWSKASEGDAVWGQTAQMVGETVVMAFGYGSSVPASTALAVYAPGNDTWLTSYYPSFLSVVSNPKAGGASSSTSSAFGDGVSAVGSAASGTAASPTASANGAGETSPGAGTAGSSSSSSSGGASSPSTENDGDSPPTPQWTAPGAAGTTTPSSNPSGSNSSTGNDKNGGGASGGTIAGAVVGSIIGALVLGAGAAFAVKRYRDNRAYFPSSSYPGGGFTGDGAGGTGLMEEHALASGGYGSSEAYNLGKRLPSVSVAGGAAAGGGVFAALSGLLSSRERFASAGVAQGRKRRFDMLKDEEEADAWDARASFDDGGEKRGWQAFADHDDAPDELSTPSLKGRGGMGIWDGFAAAGETVKTSTSYLGGALGGFVGLSAGAAAGRTRRSADDADDPEDEKNSPFADPPQQQHAYAAVAPPAQYATYADPALTPIAEWEEEEEDDDDARTELGADDSRTLESHNTHSSGTHNTASTYPTSSEASPVKGATAALPRAAAASAARPFSPTPSLYGSSFTPIVAAAGLGHALSRTSSETGSVFSGVGGARSANGHAQQMNRANSSWWSRLNSARHHIHSSEVPTPTANEAIRDPAPAPSLAADPFADAPSLSASSSVARRPSSRAPGEPDEHGRFPPGTHLERGGEHDRSISSNTSEVTATSSVLEERLRNMDVVQRIRTGSGNGAASDGGGASSCEVTPVLGTTGGDGSFGSLPSSSVAEDPFADPSPATYPPPARTPAAESVIWAGSSAGSSYAPSPYPAAYSSSSAPFRSTSTPPPVPPLPVIQPPTPTYAPPSSPRKAGRLYATGMTRSGSVKDLVAQIERKASGGSSASAGGVLSPPLGQDGRERRKKPKVEHGWARKPVLYVANPDDD
ncbi:hypothetical protein JCM10213v2_007263 [Rhodosporidiobolus nylandii]